MAKTKKKRKDWLDDFICAPISDVGEETKEKKEKSLGLFDYINDLSYNKKLIAFEQEILTGKFPSVPLYMVNKAFANFSETVYIANALNFRAVPDKVAYLFYTYATPARKRFAKWYKNDATKEADIQNLCRYFSWGMNDARENLKMFSREELDKIDRELNPNPN